MPRTVNTKPDEPITIATCPHCEKTIELMSSGQVKKAYGLGPNALVYGRKRGTLGAPWLALGNRYLYLKTAIEEFYRRDRKFELAPEALVLQLNEVLQELPAAERKKLLAQIESK